MSGGVSECVSKDEDEGEGEGKDGYKGTMEFILYIIACTYT